MQLFHGWIHSFPMNWKYFTEFFSVHVHEQLSCSYVSFKMCTLCLDPLITDEGWSVAEAFLQIEFLYQSVYFLWTSTLLPFFLKIDPEISCGDRHTQSECDQVSLVPLGDWTKMTWYLSMPLAYPSHCTGAAVLLFAPGSLKLSAHSR